MKIYTKTGDKGTTGLMGGKRVKKSSLRMESLGNIDELNAWLGICRHQNRNNSLEKILHRLQRELFTLGADISTPLEEKYAIPRIALKHTQQIEKNIDTLEAKLDPLKNFILPGGSPCATSLHGARSVCRRAERAICTLGQKETINKNILPYVNRLSDLLFVMARWANKAEGVEEEKW